MAKSTKPTISDQPPLKIHEILLAMFLGNWRDISNRVLTPQEADNYSFHHPDFKLRLGAGIALFGHLSSADAQNVVDSITSRLSDLEADSSFWEFPRLLELAIDLLIRRAITPQDARQRLLRIRRVWKAEPANRAGWIRQYAWKHGIKLLPFRSRRRS